MILHNKSGTFCKIHSQKQIESFEWGYFSKSLPTNNLTFIISKYMVWYIRSMNNDTKLKERCYELRIKCKNKINVMKFMLWNDVL